MGVIWDLVTSLTMESYPPRPIFTLQDVPDLSGKVFIVTGGNSGIGFETVKELVTHGARVFMASRSRSKAEEAIASITKDTGKSPIFLELDLADLVSVQKAARIFLEKETRLDVLYNSAGIMIPPIEQITQQGYDMQFGLVLGHFYLTKLLLPIMISTAKSSPNGKARVVNVSSGAHHFCGLDFPSFKDGAARRKRTTHALYAQSKFGMVVLTAELAKRYGDQGIVSLALNPGNVATPLQREIQGFQRTVTSFILYPVRPLGIITHMWAGTAAETAEYNGKYLRPWARLGAPRQDTQDPELGRRLWNWLEDQVQGVTE
ncbi:NAD-P-binding protein [Mycena alexandri]|uniref:NAD-P-binding protein n=1 Tax=Mycena alexandri TaxID=1745969 RepID=A0AAD6T9M2_9AGAR|nr:NAD-P-binding protein [Mycena alexandri]